MRGRPRNKGPNPLTRSFESNGPDVKIRGTAQHVADKYTQLARDAHASGDPVSAESYFQHAEHYNRLIAAAQEQFRQQYGAVQRPFDDEGEDGDEEGGPSNGYGGPGDRQSMGGDEFGEPGFQANPYAGRQNDAGRQNGERAPQQRFDRNDRQNRGQRFDNRGGERFDRNQERGDRYERGPQDRNGQDRNPQDRNPQDRQGQDRQGQDRQGQDRGPQERAERFNAGDNPRQERFDRGDRPERGERPVQAGERVDRGGERPVYDRPPPDRQDRRERFGRSDANGRQEGGPRPDGNGRDARPERAPRTENARGGYPEDDAVAGNLPAFLTNPSRQPITVGDEPRADNPPPAAAPAGEGEAPMEANGAAPARPRRRRAPARRVDAEETQEVSSASQGAAPEEALD